MILRNNSMGIPFLRGLKKQTSFFFKDKIRKAQLTLTDVTRAELLSKFNKKLWRKSYKALLLLEYLLLHGPKSVAAEFQGDKDLIREVGSFQYMDKRGIDWGLNIRKKAERILQLLEKEEVLKEERDRARKLKYGIEGSESSLQQSSSCLESAIQNESSFDWKCNSFLSDDSWQENSFSSMIEASNSKNTVTWRSLDEVQIQKKIKSVQRSLRRNMSDQSEWNIEEISAISNKNLLPQVPEWDNVEESKPLLDYEDD